MVPWVEVPTDKPVEVSLILRSCVVGENRLLQLSFDLLHNQAGVSMPITMSMYTKQIKCNTQIVLKKERCSCCQSLAIQGRE